MTTDEMMNLCDRVRETAYAIHRYHGNGYMQRVYENALAHRLQQMGLDVQQQYPLVIHDEDGTAIGDCFADLLVENELVVELKACKTVIGEHAAQLLNYLSGAGKEHGLLINFGARKFYIKKYVKSRRHGNFIQNLPLIIFAFYAFFHG